MEINIMSILVICIVAGLAWWVNETLNNIPKLKQVIQVLIVVVSVLLVLQSLGIVNSGTSLRVS